MEMRSRIAPINPTRLIAVSVSRFTCLITKHLGSKAVYKRSTLTKFSVL